ncbi:hypothetical protein N7E70_012940 [Aminobacter sp. NyZ550]|uniref:Uncharacterized protein n=1 Tax=Aminobacter aminovorans TaxID=83263 RepID=A0AAC8YNT0_AMIAI|nr:MULTISPECIES: hypothetical protein [Aminobacter]AMS41682.1 hypothetical protein AA2016_2757 [Aminobacter aminovorans]MBB3703969.1 hypothetical protein [Aminobacter aminovorans]WAX97707.1 hypothetical protein N7E70_012940 [Aminobacter sp. NyZ550]WMC95240.1 hypothetical protein RAR13_17890 [Aminobacter aminovorans]
MAPKTVTPRRGFDRYFSLGALVGSVFAGIWAGGTMVMLPNAETISELPLHVAGSVLASMVIAIFWTIPMSAVVGPIVAVMAIAWHNRPLPGFAGAMGWGAAVGLTIGLLLVLPDVVTRGAVLILSSWPLALGGIVGGTVGGAAYRALYVYRYPDEGHGRQGGRV